MPKIVFKFNEMNPCAHLWLELSKSWSCGVNYLTGVDAAELLVEEQHPTNLGMLVADVDLIRSLGLGLM